MIWIVGALALSTSKKMLFLTVMVKQLEADMQFILMEMVQPYEIVISKNQGMMDYG